jgi:uncharacterized protein YcbK (DUF882 family)
MDIYTPPNNLGLELPGRRQLLRAAALLPAMGLLPTIALADDFWNRPRELWLEVWRHGKPTGEQIRAVYWADGQIVPDGYRKICYLLRDMRSGEAVQMDVVLLDILRGMYGWFETYGIVRPIISNSGYRTPRSNANTEGAARNSMHMYGKASDVWMQGISTEYMARLGVYLSGGGVGFYPSKGFVHVDSGKLRVWRG